MQVNESVLITGAAGQDARLLVEHLNKNKINFICCSKDPEQTKSLYSELRANIVYEQLDISNTNQFIELVQSYKPNRIFNLAGLSSVVNSYANPKIYLNINGYAVENILKSMHLKNLLGKIRFYQAASSEIFDPYENSKRNENSIKSPISPYGKSKLYSYEVCRFFREKYGYFISSGILFNHESEYRSEEFVFGKITNSLARIKYGSQKELVVGNLHSQRDWGYARDYVKAMDLMTTSEIPDDYVVSTGELHSVNDVIKIAFRECDLPGLISDYLLNANQTNRVNDYNNLYGDSSKINLQLGWRPNFSFESMVVQIQRLVLKSNLGRPISSD